MTPEALRLGDNICCQLLGKKLLHLRKKLSLLLDLNEETIVLYNKGNRSHKKRAKQEAEWRNKDSDPSVGCWIKPHLKLVISGLLAYMSH